IVVGGATRLTDSGLSITEWQPLLGAIPPLTDAHWQEAFDKYRQIPEYKIVNKGMSLDEFKFIYWWEWSHRFLGRFIGVAFAVPFVIFIALRKLRPGYALKLAGVLALGALQGFFGWYMVKSGLVERVDVSHYRLALHLFTAFLILALLVWLALELETRPATIRLDTLTPGHRRMAWALVLLIMAQVVLGAFVAGLKAGLTYNTWPLMDGELVPDGLLLMQPWYVNFAENITTVQFDHRVVAYVIVLLAILHAFRLARVDDDAVRWSGAVLAVAVLLQMGLGIWTLLAAEGSIPIGLGLAHQGFAAIVLVIAVWHLHRVLRSPARA
ncbi:MAG: COX15/CtaA family protein, partial [Hyphomicrobiaceae bacterium]